MTIKPIIDETEVITLLSQFFTQPCELSPLGTGHMALVFSFRADDQEFVIRFVEKKMAHTLKKEIVVAALFRGARCRCRPFYIKAP